MYYDAYLQFLFLGIKLVFRVDIKEEVRAKLEANHL